MSDLFPLVVTDAATQRRGKRLVGPVSLTLQGESCVVVIGPNGSGKTTLLRLLHGAARLTEGSIAWACGLDAAREQQSFVFQRPIVLRRSVMENIIYPLRMRGVAKKAARGQGAVWAERVGLQDMLERPATVLSGGEQQKLALARALITASSPSSVIARLTLVILSPRPVSARRHMLSTLPVSDGAASAQGTVEINVLCTGEQVFSDGFEG